MSKSLSEMSLEELWQLFPIILKEHNPEYKNWYLEVKEKLEDLLPAAYIERINHIGSTAVSGLLAKPTVDILLEIAVEAETEFIKKWTAEARKEFKKRYSPENK